MADNLNLDFDEIVVVRDSNVAHGGVGAFYTDELVLTNKRLICLSKGVFGGTRKTYVYPLEEIKVFNGIPQVKKSKLSNGIPCLDVYLKTGEEHFSFNVATRSKQTAIVNKWINEIMRVFGNDVPIFGDNDELSQDSDEAEDDYSVASAFKEVGEVYKEVGREFAAVWGFKPKNKNKTNKAQSNTPSNSTETVKCESCGNSFKKGASFCPQCGTSVLKPKYVAAKINNVCVNCGKLLPVELMFCTQCGAAVKKTEENNQQDVSNVIDEKKEEVTSIPSKEKLSINQQIELLEKLKSLVDAGVLSQEEFEKKKKEIIE